MYFYAVYENKMGHIRLVKRGMCWPAFWLLPLWAFNNGMYGRGLWLLTAWVLAALISLLLSSGIDQAEPIFALLVFALPYLLLSSYAGLRAHLWQSVHLIQVGYKCVLVIQARSATEALLSSWEMKRETT